MRPVLAVCVWFVLLGGLVLFMHSKHESSGFRSFESKPATGGFSLEVTPTFAVEPDPFALRTGSEEQPAALVVKVNGKEVLRREDKVDGGTPLAAHNVSGMIEGPNELYLEANPPLERANRAHAVRVKVIRDGEQIADRTFWSEPGVKLAATFRVDVRPREEKGKDAHGH
ncbi:MAG: hypothetical protein AB1473_10835 [Thermodesulfobacteriota bacterium]